MIPQRSADVLVIPSTSSLCRPTVTSTPRGRYSWGAAPPGHSLRRPCQRADPAAAGDPGERRFARLLCGEDRRWADGGRPDASQCGFTSKVG